MAHDPTIPAGGASHAPRDLFSVRADCEEAFQRAVDLLGPRAVGRAIGHAHTTISRDRQEQAAKRGVALLHVFDRAEQDLIARAAAHAGDTELLYAFQRLLGDASADLHERACHLATVLRAEQRTDAALSIAIHECLDEHGTADPREANRLIPMVEARMARDRNVVMPKLRAKARLMKGGAR